MDSTIEILNTLLSSKNVQKYDLMTLLSIITDQMTKLENPEIPYINSTLTKLFSLSNINCRLLGKADKFTWRFIEWIKIHILIIIFYTILDFKFDNSQIAQIISIQNCGQLCNICYIFNYQNYINRPEKERHGTVKDVESLEETFNKMNFKIRKFNNLRKDQTITKLEEISKENFSNFRSIVICFLSHGSHNGILDCSDGHIYRSDIIKSLNSNSSLDGKPKLLFIQACRGNLEDEGIALIEESDSKIDSKQKFERQKNLFVLSSSYPGKNIHLKLI